MRYAIIKNDIVINIIVADEQFIDEHYAGAINVDGVDCGIDWTHINGEFIAPIVEDDSETL
jgi:hypothetical protein